MEGKTANSGTRAADDIGYLRTAADQSLITKCDPISDPA